MPVDRKCRIGLVTLQDQFHRFASGAQLRIGQRPLAKQRRVAGRDQQRVAGAQRHFETLGEVHHHFAAR